MAKNRGSTPMGYGPGAWKMIGRGIELGAIIGGLTFLGHLGDERWGTGPWLTFSGALLATLGGCYNLAKDMMFPKKKRTAKDASGDDSQA